MAFPLLLSSGRPTVVHEAETHEHPSTRTSFPRSRPVSLSLWVCDLAAMLRKH